MLNYETLLSTYDDKLTLMQWLKKVEAALKDASAVSFNVNKRGNATITFSVVFEDGSELETDPIILQQGESVTNATITNGHLILTLSNGDTLDAGNLGAVSGFSINGSQHLIVAYQDGTTQDLGAIFSGNVNIAGTLTTSGNISTSAKISGAEIVEDMYGYSFVKSTDIAGLTKEYIYAAAVKNGNKLTFVIAVNLTRTGEMQSGYIDFGYFAAPQSILDRIYPTEIGGAYFVDLKQQLLIEGFSSTKQCNCYMQKAIGTLPTVAYVQDPNNNMVLNTKYYARYEVTLLLSENLAA